MRTILAASLLVLLAAVACGERIELVKEDLADTGARAAAASTVTQVVGKDLIDAYDANPVAANQKYEGRILEITGTIEGFGNIFGINYLVLSDGGFKGIQCFFSDRHVNQLAALQKGQTVIVRGQVDGYYVINVGVSGCTVVSS